MTYAISGASCLGCNFAGDTLGSARRSRLARRVRRGLGTITPPGDSDYQNGYPVDGGIRYVDTELFGVSEMADAFVPSMNEIQTLGPSAVGEPTIEDSEFKDVGAPIEGAPEAKAFSGLALLGLAALGYFIFIRK